MVSRIIHLGMSTGGGGGGGEDAATTAWAAAVTTAGGTVSTPRRTVVDTFIKACKTAGVWTTLDRYWLLAGEDAGSAKVDMVNLQSFTVVNTPTFTPSVGYASPSPVNYINTGYIPTSSAVNYTLNSGSFGGQMQNNRTTNAGTPILGSGNAANTGWIYLIPLSGSQTSVQSNTSAVDSGAPTITTTLASYIISRTGASAGAIYINGTSYASIVSTAVALPDGAIFILAASMGGSPYAWPTNDDSLSSFFIGGGWNSTQAAAFEAAQNAMMTSIGINVHA